MLEVPHTTVKSVPPMKSVRYHGAGDIRIEEISEPICGKGEVKVYSQSFFLPCLILDADGERFGLHLLESAVVVCLVLS